MGYQADGVALYSTWSVDPDAYGTWVGPDTINQGVLAPLRAAGQLAHATHYWLDLGKPAPIESGVQLAALARTWRSEIVALYAGELAAPDWELHLALDPAQLRLTFGLGARFIDSTTRDTLAQLVARWSELLAPRGCRLAVATLEPPRTPYPRPRPPRASRMYSLGALDYYFGRAWHRRRDHDVLAAIEGTPLPPGTTRTANDELVHVAFTADLRRPRAVAAARVASESWLSSLIPTEIECGWNALGDRVIVPPVRAADLAPFTYYDAGKHVAYKALLIDRDGHAIDESMWATLVRIIRAGELHRGRPVDAVRLVLPARDAALAIHDRAITDGFEMVTYPKGKVLWQVNPP